MPQVVKYNATLILVLGILGLVMCPVFGLFAWSMGTSAIREIDNPDNVASGDRSLINAGRILGIISSVLWLAILLIIYLNGHR